MNLAGYIRVSTSEQVDAFGKEIQMDGILRFANLNGHRVTEWFEEDAVSGKVDGGDRPEMAKIIARADEFDGVIAFDATRIARRLLVQETLFGLLWSAGLRVFTAAAGEVEEDDDPTRVLVRQVLGVLAEFEHRTIVRRLQSGRKAKIKAGGFAGGTPAYGFKVEGTGKQAVVVEDVEEQKTIAWMEELRTHGHTLLHIAMMANLSGVPTKRGKKWTPTQIQRILNRDG